MKRNSLVSGAIILTLSAILAKIFSAVYRIMLTRMLGGVGIGLYQLVFPIYSMCIVLSTTGIPLAVSKVVSKNENSKQIVGFCLKFVAIISILLAVLIFTFSEPIAKGQGDQRIAICFRLLAPSLIIVGISSVLKGYFQGKMNYFPSAISQVVEQFVKFVFGLLFVAVLIKFNVIYAIVGAIAGIVLSEIVTFVILIFNFKSHNLDNNENVENFDKKQIIKDILPITFTNLILPLASFIDSIIVVRLLRINFDAEMSIFLYGLESGAVNNIITLPTLFSFAMASAIMPSFSSKKQGENKFSKLCQLVFLITIPCVLMFIVAPEGILKILYSNRLSLDGVDGIAISTNLLRIGGIGTLFLALNQILSSYLQANDKRLCTIRNLICGVILKFIVEILLLTNIDINIYALAIANTVCYLTAFILNLIEVKKFQTLKIENGFFIKVGASCALMLLVYFVVAMLGQNVFISLLSYLFAGIVYLISMYLLDVVPIKKYKKIN